MTMRYAHMITAHLHDAMAKFDTKVGTSKAVSDDRKAKDIELSY